MERSHYDSQSLTLKRERINEWLGRCAPKWVLDLGCNTGEFSRMAADHSAHVVSVDADHASVQALYRASNGSACIYPVVAPLDDLSGGRGWLGSESPGLADRLTGRFDLVMMLALVHHLAIAQLARRFTRGHLIVEWLAPDDVQVVRLCEQRRRDPAEFSLEAQRRAFAQAGFAVESETPLAQGRRVLALLKLEP